MFPLAVKLHLPSYYPDMVPETPRLQRRYFTMKLLGRFIGTFALLLANTRSFKIMSITSARISLPLSVSKKWLTLESSSTIDIRAWQSNTLPSSDRLVKRGWWNQLRTSPRGTIRPGWLISNTTAPDVFPYPITVISESDGSNNTLSHGLCTDFEDGTDSGIGNDAQATWAAIFAPPITARLNKNLSGANLSAAQTIYMMDLCPFNTIASDIGAISPFCSLFSAPEWHQYDYYQSLGKYYGFGNGNPLGPTQGVGFTNELIARMTGKPVTDHTSVNHTLDESNTTFPLGRGHVLYADFSHDK